LSGAWTLRTNLRTQEQVALAILSPVEETHGAMFHKPTDFEERLNAHVERLISDWLLFLAHRMLFGQCRALEPNIPGTTDLLLILGPTLPKFVGRICYSNLSRKKTIAVLAPAAESGEIPEQSSLKWTQNPIPRYHHDCARRRWVASDGLNRSELRRVSAFDVIQPVGDGLAGEITPTLVGGPRLWQSKAALVQNILDTDRLEARFAIWKNESVFVPRGIKSAMRTALLQREFDRLTRRAGQLKQRLSTHSKRLVDEGIRRAERESRGSHNDKSFERVVIAQLTNDLLNKASRADATSTTLSTLVFGNDFVTAGESLVERLGESIRPQT
jgi:hypothetical protein